MRTSRDGFGANRFIETQDHSVVFFWFLLIKTDAEVIDVTFAVVKGFGGSTFGVPIRYAKPLLGAQQHRTWSGNTKN